MRNPSIKAFREKYKGFTSAPPVEQKKEHKYRKPAPFELLQYRHYYMECVRADIPVTDIQCFRDWILDYLNALYKMKKISRKEKQRLYRKFYYYGHWESELDKGEEYYQNHKVQHSVTGALYYQNHKDKICRQSKERYRMNREKRLRQCKEYNSRNGVKRHNQYIRRRDTKEKARLVNFTFNGL